MSVVKDVLVMYCRNCRKEFMLGQTPRCCNNRNIIYTGKVKDVYIQDRKETYEEKISKINMNEWFHVSH